MFIFYCAILVNVSYQTNIKKSLTYRECVFAMSYVKKACPVCGKEFFVLRKAEEKAIYCTLACLTKAQDKCESRKVAFPGLG